MSNGIGGMLDWIDGLFRFAMGFFAGMVVGYTAQLAEVTSWVFAVATLAVVTALVVLSFKTYLAIDGAMQRFFDWIGGVKYPGGIKPPKRPAPEPKPHWFVRFGWLPALVIGSVAVYVLPEEVLAWF